MSLQSTLKALADPTRREILNLLKAGPRPAGDIADQFSISAAAVSRHLSVLKDADLIRDTREGKYIPGHGLPGTSPTSFPSVPPPYPGIFPC